MKSLINDEKADASSMLVIVTSIFVFGMFYSLLTYGFNAPIQVMNTLITDSLVSADTAYYFNLSLDMWKASPFFLILGLVLYSYERSKGTDLEINVYFEYMFLMIIGLTVSTFLVYGFGLAVDGIVTNLDGTILTDVSETWGTTETYRSFIIKMVYYFCMSLEVISIILYVFHPIIKQKEITIFQRENDKEQETDYSTNLGQF